MFAYQTPKIVKIQDRTLGLLRIFLMLAIFIYIFIFNIWYKGQHFVMSSVDGIARLQWQEPMAKNAKGKRCGPLDIECAADYHATTELPYCGDYTGSEPESVQRRCDFFDAQELPVDLRMGVLLPTRIATFKQVRTCSKDATTCERKYSFVDANNTPQEGDGKALPISDSFVADVEDFTVLIDHSFRTANGKVAYDDFAMQGYYEVCDEDRSVCETKKMICAHDGCDKKTPEKTSFSIAPRSGGSRPHESEAAKSGRFRKQYSQGGASFLQLDSDLHELANRTDEAAHDKRREVDTGDAVTVKSIQDGDVFSLKTLMAMTGLTLNDLADPDSDDTETIRDRGTAIVLRIKYNNMHHWQLLHPEMPPEYTVSVTRRPVKTFKDSEVQRMNEEGRILKTKYGIYLIVNQTGSIGTFDLVHMLITLTAAMTLLAMSNMLTDMLAFNVLPRKDEYQSLKYQVSEDYVTVKSEKEGESKKESDA